jgi:Asp-tRNA(Asn)/Glu-tRNA(Gln) amidotransferase A subunit family amidase
MVAAGVVPIAHATDGGGSIRIPAGVNGNIGLKVSRGVFSLAPNLSDLTGLVSIQGCQSRSVRDTAAFVDACRGPAPGELMPFWTSPEPYTQLITHDPPTLRIALSHQWGDYRATPPIAAELERVGQFLEGLGHHVDYALPPVDYRAAFDAQTTCYISNFAQVIGNLLAARGLERPPADLVEPINIRIWEAGRHTTLAERARMQAIFNTTSRGFGAFFKNWDIILTPITALPTPKVGTTEYLTISDNPSVLDWFGSRATSPTRRSPIFAASPRSHYRSPRMRTSCRWASKCWRSRPTTGCCFSWRRRSRGRSAANGTQDRSPTCT